MKIQIHLILIVAAAILTQSDADHKLIETTCRKTPYYKLCMSIIQAEAGSPRMDVADLALVLVEHMKQTIIKTLDKIKKLTNSGAKELRPGLENCNEGYTIMLEVTIPLAERATRGNPKFAENAVADAKVESLVCEEGFQGVAPPLSAENKYMGEISDVARGIIRNLL